MFLLFESKLHVSDLELFNRRDHIEFTGSVRSHAIVADRAQLIDLALRFVTVAFKLRGRSIVGLDENQVFPSLFGIAGFQWKFDKLPERMRLHRRNLKLVRRCYLPNYTDKKCFAPNLGAEQVM